jgi:O-antigen/teichoic acid export membrane protein
MLAKSRYYIVSNMMITIFAQTDRIMLKLMIDDAAAGYYSAAVTCAGITGFVFSAIIDSMRPMIFESKKTDNLAFEKNVSRLYSVIIYLSLAQSIVMTLFAPLIVNILYGAEYQNTIGILQVLVWYTTFSYMGAVRNIWILAEDKQRYLWIINLSGALTNVVLNSILIPLLGGIGAAVASVITQVFTNVVIGFVIKPIIHNNKLILKGCNPLLLKEMLKTILSKSKV